MFAKHFAAGLAAAALLSTVAFAQAPAPAAKDPPPTGQSSSTPRAETPAKQTETQSSDQWRGSKVIGLYVYNDANERLGSINRGPGKLPPPFDSYPVEIWGQTREQWQARKT